MKKNLNNKGITLIALIVTLVVLLILAGVSLNLLLNDNSLIKKTHEAKQGYQNAEIADEEEFGEISGFLDDTLGEDSEFIEPEEPLIEVKGSIPKGSKYYVGVTEIHIIPTGYDLGKCEQILEGGKDNFPIPKKGDVFVYGDYEYRYQKEYHKHSNGNIDWITNYSGGNWGVRVINPNKERYGRILSKINNAPVDIAINTFSDLPNIVEAPELPDSILYAKYIYMNSPKLKTIKKFPKNIIEMDAACRNCYALENVPDLYSDMPVSNLEDVFRDCHSLKIMPELPLNTLNLDSTFRNCYNLKIVKRIPLKVENMRATFCRCYAITNSPVLPNNVTNMERTFYRCYELKIAPKLPLHVQNLSETFKRCFNIERAPEIPSSVTNMYSTFEYCTRLKYPCSKIPEGVTSLLETFKDTSLMEYPIISSTVENLDWTFYQGKYWHDEIFYKTTQDANGNTVLIEDLTKYEIPKVSYATKAPIIPLGVKTMDFTFSNNDKLLEIGDIPDTVISMHYTFGSCDVFSKIGKLSNNVQNLDSTFEYCDYFENAPVIPNTVTNMDKTFKGCDKRLANIPEIPENVTTMKNTFMYCYRLNGTLSIKTNKILDPLNVVGILDGCAHDEYHKITITGTPENLAIREKMREQNNPLEWQTFTKGQYITVSK